MYHDLALAPLKALYFDKSINVSLNLPIIRVSVDHGTAFDKAYKNAKINTKSYFEAANLQSIYILKLNLALESIKSSLAKLSIKSCKSLLVFKL